MPIFALFVLVILFGMVISRATKAQDSEYVKQILRLEYTTFCHVVGKPPQALAEALNQSVAQDPKTWLPVVQWWNRIAEKYAEAKCGDA